LDRITESLLNEFSQENSVTNLPEDRQFENFAAYIVTSRQLGEALDTTEIVTGSGGDTGIDAIAVIVNGTLMTDVEAFDDHCGRVGALDVTFVFVQAERSAGFNGAKIGQFQYGVLDFFKDQPTLKRNPMVTDAAAVMAAIYKQSSKFKRAKPACRMYYITTGIWQGDQDLEARRATAVSDIKALNLFHDVEFSCLGASELQKLYNQTKNAISREFQFASKVTIPELPNVAEAYLGFVPAMEFLKLVTDESGMMLKSIFYDNVRDWQDYNDVNSQIQSTLVSDRKPYFVLMNNGVTIIARTLRATGNKVQIEDYQIVNGCQTSHVISDQSEHLDSTVLVPLRLIGTQDEDVINAIIQATNQQTEVKREQFLAMNPFAKKIESYFQTFSNGKRLYFERRSHQYDAHSVEKVRIITIGNLIRAFASMFLTEPHAVTRSYRSIADKVGKEIFADTDRSEPYYVSAFSLHKLEAAFRNSRIDSKLKPARFHLLLAIRLITNPQQLPRMNSHEMERYCKVIQDILWDADKSDEVIQRAAQVITDAANGDFSRDNIRTTAFTEKIRSGCSTPALAAS
jgi:hypothetical protein